MRHPYARGLFLAAACTLCLAPFTRGSRAVPQRGEGATGHQGGKKTLEIPSREAGRRKKPRRGLVLPKPRKASRGGPSDRNEHTQARPGKGVKGEGAEEKGARQAGPGLAAFLESLGSKETVGTEELIAEYALLGEPERTELRRMLRKLPSLSLRRLARVYRDLPEPRALPLLLRRLRRGKLGKEAADVVEAVVDLAGLRGSKLATELLGSRFKAVRLAAEQILRQRMSAGELPAVRKLLDHAQRGARLAAVRILGHWLRAHQNQSLQPLVDCLSHRDGGVRTEATRQLLEEGDRAVASLQALVKSSSAREGYFLACYLLANQELRAERDLLPENGIPRLVMALRSDKPLQRSVAALVLAMRHFRDPGSGVTGLRAALASGNLDQSALIDELLGIVDVREFFPEGGLCHRSALLMLELLSGNGFGADPTRWRSWWQKARHDFRAYRVSLPLDSIAAERMKLGYYVGSRLKFSILGSDAAEPEQGQGGLRFRLTGEAMFALLKDLKRRGMMNIGARLDRAEPGPEKRFLILESREGRVRDGFASSEHPRLKSILLALESLMEREMWQGFCPRDLDADGRREWWKRQSRSMATAEDDAARRDRVLELCCRALPDLDGAGRKRAIGLLLEEAGSRDTRLNPERALGLLSLVDSGKMSNEEDRALLEVVALIKGGNVFAKLLGVISHRPELGTGDLLPRLLALAGPDKIILAMNHRNPSIRESAASQTANLKDSRSYPALLRLLRDASPRVRAAAIRSVGRLGLREAAAALQDLATDADDLVRRAALVALGPVGGKHAFEILHEATTRESAGDRLAAVRGLGKLRDPRTSSVLVKLASAHYPKPLGLQAMLGLKGRGGFELRAMVNQAYQAAQEDELKLEFLFLLGEMQDPRVFQPVLRLMSRGVRQTRCCRILAGISGLDACDSALPERVKTYEKWWRQHHDEGAASWLLLALSRERTKTSLRLDDLEKRATGTVLEELCRIVEKAKNWATRAVAVGLLREHTGRDYGTVQADTSFGAVQALAERYRAYARARSSIGGK